MPKTLLRGLDLMEIVDMSGPLTISEIARQLGIDVSTVSRTVAACERDGWLVRHEGRIAVGPRCALLGLNSPATRAIRAAEPLVHAITAAAGVGATASALVGAQTMILASAVVSGGAAGPAIPVGTPSRIPVYVLADGLAIAAQLSPAHLDAILPAEPYPGLPVTGTASAVAGFVAAFPGAAGGEPAMVRTRRRLDGQLNAIRADGFSRDPGTLHPSIGCIARPWPAAGLPAAIACVGQRDEIASRRALIEACLTAATEPGATSHEVIRAAVS